MRRRAFLIGIIATALIGVAPATAQAAWQRLQLRSVAVKKPPIRMTAAMAAQRFRAMMPDAKLLRVIRLSNDRFLVVFHRANRVERIVLGK